jgi:hypothetical protein
MKENYSNQKKKQKRKKEKNLFNLLPKTSISDSDALGMTVVVLDSGRKKESLGEGTLKRRIGSKRVRWVQTEKRKTKRGNR